MNCYIYKLFCIDSNIEDVYIGSTCNVRQRMIGHKIDCNNPNGKKYNCKVYKFIRANKGWNNWKMEILEEFGCKSKFEKLQKERGWKQYIQPSLNSCIPSNFKMDGE